MKKNRHIGSNFDDFLDEKGLLAGAEAVAAKRVLAFLVQREMKRQRLSKSKMAAKMQTSRAALDRLLDPDNTAVTLHTMERTASALGKRLKIELV
jgi:antitoxin HicB